MAEVTQRTFDLHSWKGLTEVLQIARNSRLSRAEYAQFRDLVLSYAQEGGDQEKKTQIEKILARLETLPEPKKEGTIDSSLESHAPSRTLGRRIVPTFGVRKLSVTHEVSAPTTNKSHGDVVKLVEKVSPAPVPIESVAAQVAILDTPQASTPQEVHATAQPTEEAMSPVAPRAVKAESPVKSLEEYRARIMEVKREVNARVGNPVTLIDAGNHVGRTYMNALLSAMKATNPGSTMNVVKAIEELEAAYDAVIAHVEGRSVQTPKDVPTPDVAQEQVPTVPQKEEASVPAPVETYEEGVNISASSVLGAELLSGEVTEKSLSEYAKEKDVVMKSNETSVSSAVRPRIPSLADIERTQVPLQKETPRTKEVREPEKKSSFSLSALVKSKPNSEAGQKLETTTTEPETRDVKEMDLDTKKASEGTTPKVAVGTNQGVVNKSTLTGGRHIPPTPVVEVSKLMPTKPDALTGNLMTPEITQSLGQLLHEWSLFASSGIFGTGPGGFEHPLYKKLAEVKMEEIVLGRWDGASPKITSAIRDYIDAWRHEQGVAYNPTETFEHYLRRVVDRILKRQKGIRGV